MRLIAISILLMVGIAGDLAWGQTSDEANATVGLTTQNRSVNLQAAITTSAGDSTIKFIRFAKVDDAKKATIREDANILHWLIAQELPLKSPPNALGVTLTRSFTNAEIDYNDHGLVYSYSVPAPLVNEGGSGEAEPQDGDVSEWDKAKAAMKQKGYAVQPALTVMNRAQASFDQDYVDRISEHIEKALSQAGNFRDLVPSDTITVFVYGISSHPSQRSVMAWRVKMSDFQAGQLTTPSAIERTSYLEEGRSGWSGLHLNRSGTGAR